MEACSLLVNLGKGMQSSSKQPLVGEERYATTLITAAKETTKLSELADTHPTLYYKKIFIYPRHKRCRHRREQSPELLKDRQMQLYLLKHISV